MHSTRQVYFQASHGNSSSWIDSALSCFACPRHPDSGPVNQSCIGTWPGKVPNPLQSKRPSTQVYLFTARAAAAAPLAVAAALAAWDQSPPAACGFILCANCCRGCFASPGYSQITKSTLKWMTTVRANFKVGQPVNAATGVRTGVLQPPMS